MLNYLLAVSEENALKGFPKNISVGEAALYALLGFLTVFLGIALLIFIVWLVGKIITKVTMKKKVPQETKKKEEQSSVSLVSEDEISEETVAVITAAIMAYYQEQPKKCEFTVKRIKKV